MAPPAGAAVAWVAGAPGRAAAAAVSMIQEGRRQGLPACCEAAAHDWPQEGGGAGRGGGVHRTGLLTPPTTCQRAVRRSGIDSMLATVVVLIVLTADSIRIVALLGGEPRQRSQQGPRCAPAAAPAAAAGAVPLLLGFLLLLKLQPRHLLQLFPHPRSASAGACCCCSSPGVSVISTAALS